jgi:hypothetical protein
MSVFVGSQWGHFVITPPASGRDATTAFIVLLDPELRELYDLGVSPHLILSEDVDPFILFCGLPPQVC